MKYASPAFFSAALLLAALAAGSAHAATFIAEIKGQRVTVYATAQKKEHCMIHNTFSYVVNGNRYTTTQECNVDTEVGKHLEVCHVEHTDINEAKIEKPIEIVACHDNK